MLFSTYASFISVFLRGILKTQNEGENNMDITLGERISTLRRQKEMTQESLAKELNVSAQAVSKWENDQTCPDISLLPELARILGVTVDELLSGKTDMREVRMAKPDEEKNPDDLILRIIVDSADGDKVRVNLPVPLIQAAIELGITHPKLGGSEALKNIDIGRIVELVRRGARGNLVEVEEPGGDRVLITVE